MIESGIEYDAGDATYADFVKGLMIQTGTTETIAVWVGDAVLDYVRHGDWSHTE